MNGSYITGLTAAISPTSGDALPLAQSDGKTHAVHPGALSVTATGSLTPRNLSDRAADAANVLDFGADPTGGSSSVSAFNAALILGRRIYIPSGTYLIDSAITLPNVPVTLIGDGMNSAILKFTGSAGMTQSHNQPVEAVGLQWLANTAGIPLNIAGSGYCSIRENYFKGTASATPALLQIDANTSFVDGNLFTMGSALIGLNLIANSVNTIVSNTHVYTGAQTGTGIAINGGSTTIGVQGVFLNGVCVNGCNIGLLIENTIDFVTINGGMCDQANYPLQTNGNITTSAVGNIYVSGWYGGAVSGTPAAAVCTFTALSNAIFNNCSFNAYGTGLAAFNFVSQCDSLSVTNSNFSTTSFIAGAANIAQYNLLGCTGAGVPYIQWNNGGSTKFQVDYSGNVTRLGGGIETGVQYAGAGGSISWGGAYPILFVNGSGTIASAAITMPPPPSNPATSIETYQLITVDAITAITWALNGGNFGGAPLPTSLPAGGMVTFKWFAALGGWIHVISA